MEKIERKIAGESSGKGSTQRRIGSNGDCRKAHRARDKRNDGMGNRKTETVGDRSAYSKHRRENA